MSRTDLWYSLLLSAGVIVSLLALGPVAGFETGVGVPELLLSLAFLIALDVASRLTKRRPR
jgi:hypothetical protein